VAEWYDIRSILYFVFGVHFNSSCRGLVPGIHVLAVCSKKGDVDWPGRHLAQNGPKMRFALFARPMDETVMRANGVGAERRRP